MDDANKNWAWWAGISEEWFTVGPCMTRDDVIAEMKDDGSGEWLDESQDPPQWMISFNICEARQDPIRLADWIGVDFTLQEADERLADSDRVGSEYDYGPWFEVTPEQEQDLTERLRRACDEWQSEHELVFTCNTFSHQRNEETICLPVTRQDRVATT